MKINQIKIFSLGTLLGFAFVVLFANNEDNNINHESFNGRYRFYESSHNPEKLYLVDVYSGNLFIWDSEFDNWQEKYSEIKRY